MGLEIGRGKRVEDVLQGLTQVAEGVRTTRSAWELSQRHEVDMPITEETYRVLYEGKDPRVAMADLTRRRLKSETE